jgi:hypothetical protein
MRYFGINEKNQFSFFGLFLLFIGIGGMIFSLAFDFFRAGVPNFGINQLAGFVVSTIIALAGLRKIELLRAKIWDGLLLMFSGLYRLPDLNKLVFPQVGEKFLPGDGQYVVGKGTYRVLADKDEIFKYAFFF